MSCIFLPPFLCHSYGTICRRLPKCDLPIFPVRSSLAHESVYSDVREMAECFVKGSISFSSFPWIKYDNKVYKILTLELNFSINNPSKNYVWYYNMMLFSVIKTIWNYLKGLISLKWNVHKDVNNYEEHLDSDYYRHFLFLGIISYTSHDPFHELPQTSFPGTYFPSKQTFFSGLHVSVSTSNIARIFSDLPILKIGAR